MTIKSVISDVKTIAFTFPASTAVEIGDLLYNNSGTAAKASAQADQLTEPANQRLFASLFLGISKDKRLSTETDAPLRTVDTDAIVDATCPSTTWAFGDLVGASENGGGTALLDTQVEKVTDPSLAIGYCVKAGTSITTVRVRLIGKYTPNTIRVPYIDAGDNDTLYVGSSLPQTISDGDGATDLTPVVQILGTAKADSSLLLAAFNVTNDNTVCPSVNLLKSGNAAIGSNTVVASGEVLGEINFFGSDGTDFESPAARIQAAVDATAATGDMPGRLVFSTTADGGETLTEAMRITSSQDVRINDGGGLIVGSTSAQVTISDGDGTTNLIPEVQVLGTAKADASVLIAAFNATDDATVAPSLNFLKSGNAVIGSNTVVAANEILGEISFFGDNGTDYESPAARMHVAVNATPGAADMAGRFVFSTSSDGGETLVERMRIAEAGVTLGLAGTTLGKLLFSGNTAGTVTVQSAATAGDWTMTLPADDGDAGEQLQTNGSGVTTWEAAGSMRAVKHVIAEVSDRCEEVLERLLGVGVYEFRYQEKGRPTTGDYSTVYTGVMADELPEVMHHNGRIFSPVSAFGEMLLALKGLARRVERMEAAAGIV